MFFATLFWREPDLQIYNRAQWLHPSIKEHNIQVMRQFAKCILALLLFEEIGMEISVQSRIEKCMLSESI